MAGDLPVATFQAESEGGYSIDVIGPNTAGAIVAMGDDVARSSIPSILGCSPWSRYRRSEVPCSWAPDLQRRKKEPAMRTRERMPVQTTDAAPLLASHASGGKRRALIAVFRRGAVRGLSRRHYPSETSTYRSAASTTLALCLDEPTGIGA